MMSTIDKNESTIRHALILIISSSILIVILAFCFWLHGVNKEQIDKTVSAEMDRAKVVTQKLADLQKKELNLLARTIVQTPILKGALATGHLDTIEDVLTTISEQSGVDHTLILKQKRLLFKDKGTDEGLSIKSIVAGKFIGRTEIPLPSLKGHELLVVKSLRSKDLLSWSEASNVDYAVFDKNQKLIVNGLPENASATYRSESIDKLIEVDHATLGAQYLKTISLLKGTLNISMHMSKKPIWQNYLKEKNTLLILGASLFLFGILISIIFAYLFERYILKRTRHTDEKGTIDKLIKEVEEVKASLFKHKTS